MKKLQKNLPKLPRLQKSLLKPRGPGMYSLELKKLLKKTGKLQKKILRIKRLLPSRRLKKLLLAQP